MAIPIHIRLCSASDAEMLALIGSATFLETFADSIYAPDIVAHCTRQHSSTIYADWLADPNSRCWLAETEGFGVAVGYQVLTKPDLPVPDHDIGDIELKRIYFFSPLPRWWFGRKNDGTGNSGRHSNGPYTAIAWRLC